MSLDAIELRHLRFFVALAEELSFKRGAERSNVSQPPFSVAIQQLEAHLGVMLVIRSSRGVQLTVAGETFYQHAKRVIAQAQEAYTVSRGVAGGTKGRLRIGFHASMLFRGLPEAVEAIEHHEPQIQIELVEMPSYDQVRALTTGALDLGFAHTTLAPEGISSVTVYSEPLVVCLPKSHRLARRQSIELGELQREQFIIFSRAASPAYFDRILSLCLEAGFTANIRHQVRQWLTVVSMVSKGLGIAIVPASLANSGVPAAFVALRDDGAISTIQCMWLSQQETPLLRRMLDYVREHVSARTLIALSGG
ncbi:MAG: LysR family transcriptional regulator [Hyphomicrobiales bacterium]|nr:MAG: LysR family transcriptional regulator [Hyphomicrobiales bacterium]